MSQRLTLVCLCVALGLTRFMVVTTHQPLPGGVAAWVVGLVSVMISHQWAIIQEGGYFTFFQETALFSDGLLVLIVLTWGLWALLQVPTAWFRRLRWAGLFMVALNLVYATAQALGIGWHLGSFHPFGGISGIMGADRSLGAYGVAWLPIFYAWHPSLALLPLLLVFHAGKMTAWLGVAVIACWMLPKVKWVAMPLAVWAAFTWGAESLWIKLEQRGLTWWHTIQAIVEHPFIGWGFHPMTSMQVNQQFGYSLPGFHSDWLSLAFSAGLPIVLGAGLLISRIARGAPTTRWGRALQASLIAVAVMSLGQPVVSRACIGGLMLLFLAWYLCEVRMMKEES